MHHGRLDRNTALGLRALRERIEESEIPSSRLDETITIATWNIRDFGRKKRLNASIHFIAEIIGQFDLVAGIEVRDNLEDLHRVLQILGPYWDVVFSDFNADPAGNRERVAYIYDKRAVVFTGLAAEADPPRERATVIPIAGGPQREEYISKISWWRSPFMASFRAGNFDFILLAAHIRWGKRTSDRIAPLKLLAQWIAGRRKEPFVIDSDFILMGDFNITSRRSQTFKEIVKHGLEVPPALMKGNFGTNLAKDKRYDQILHHPMHPTLYQDRRGRYRSAGGVLDFLGSSHKPLYPGRSMTKREFTYQLSDHLPLWLQLNIWDDDIELDQMIARRARRR